jgi:hypothetical protein
MAKTLYREYSNKYGSSRSAYTGCSTTARKGELAAHGFDKCIVHLDDTQASEYEASLRGGVGALNFSSLEVDADFVNGWVSRIATDAEGYKRVPVAIVMQHTRMVDALVFHRNKFPRGLMLQGLKADAVRIGESTISGGLSLDSAEIEDEVSLQQLSVDNITLVASRAKILWLLNCSIERKIDARSLTLNQGLHLRGSDIGESANFRDSRLGEPKYNVTISSHFRSTADFTDCVFPAETQVGRYADLPPSIFEGPTLFEGSTFGGEDFGAVSFRECQFQDRVSFKNVEVYGGVSFSTATFQAPADLTGLKVRAAPYSRGEDVTLYPSRAFDFTTAIVNSDLNLGAVVDGDACVQDVSLGSLSEGLLLSSSGYLQVKRVSLERFSVLDLASERKVELDQVQLQAGGRLRINAPEADLTSFACARPVVVSGTRPESQPRPKLMSLDGSDCQGLTLAGLDYSQTRFLGATNLDHLTISGQFILSATSGLRSRRAFLKEEALVRAGGRRSAQWSSDTQNDAKPSELAPSARELAAVYRALRKGREDQKDEAGSIDFYYGEMEMRRIASHPFSVERLILTTYWLVAGYGLRAWRALTLLLGVLVGSALVLMAAPLRRDSITHPTFGDALLFTGQSGLSLSGPGSLYSTSAQVVQVALRIIVPLLIALVVLSLRARVKR